MVGFVLCTSFYEISQMRPNLKIMIHYLGWYISANICVTLYKVYDVSNECLCL